MRTRQLLACLPILMCSSASVPLKAQTSATGQGVPAAQGSSPAQSASSVLPDAPTLGPDYGPLPAAPLSAGQKSTYYLKRAFGPGAFAGPILAGAYRMANPPDRYPREWRQGAAAYGRNVGSDFNLTFAANTGRYLTGLALHEDPRYYPSEDRRFTRRVSHALVFTVINRSDSGRPRLAVSNFAGAVGGGFVGIPYMPHGWNDATHAGQRSLEQFGGFGADNLTREFAPELKAIARKLHLPAPKF